MEYKKDSNGVIYDSNEVGRQSEALKRQIFNYETSCKKLIAEFEKIENILGNGSQHSQASKSIQEFHDVYNKVNTSIADKFRKLTTIMDEWVTRTKEAAEKAAQQVKATTASMETSYNSQTSNNA